MTTTDLGAVAHNAALSLVAVHTTFVALFSLLTSPPLKRPLAPHPHYSQPSLSRLLRCSMASDPALAAPFVAAPYMALPPPAEPAAPAAWYASRKAAGCIAVAVLVAVSLVILGLLATFGPTSWYSNNSSATSPYAGSVCQRRSAAGEPSSNIRCTAAADNDRCCPLPSGWGAVATCSADGYSCYGYNGIRRFVIIAALWVSCLVSLCTVCGCLACHESSAAYRRRQAAESVYLVVEDGGGYGRVQ